LPARSPTVGFIWAMATRTAGISISLVAGKEEVFHG